MATLSRELYDELLYLHDEDEVSPGYSGRGMYGDTCLGYHGSQPMLFVFDLARLLAGDDDADEIRREISERLSRFSTDSMGRGTIFYWPSVRVEGAEEEDEEDD